MGEELLGVAKRDGDPAELLQARHALWFMAPGIWQAWRSASRGSLTDMAYGVRERLGLDNRLK